MDPLLLAGVLVSVLAGAATQRVTGLGFALVAAPFLVLVLGPFQGVLLSNLLTCTVSVVMLLVTWRHVDLRRVALLAAPALVAVPAGAWVARTLPGPQLLIAVGGLVLVGLVTALCSQRARVFRGRTGAVAAGAMSGFMNASAGVGGPAVTLYALSTDWRQPTFIPSIQFYFALISAGSLVAKGFPTLPAATLALVMVALGAGLVLGQLLSRRLSAERARSAVAAIALLGAAGTVVKGVVGLGTLSL
jgi:uncharacterized membrane protein YfcA